MSQESFILALDQGTTSSRAILFDHSGSILATGQKEFRQYYPEPGWVEQDPLEIWESQCEVIHSTIREAQIKPKQIAALGITNQRETVVVWERASGKPVCPAIVWQDRRTAGICSDLIQAGHQERVMKRTGLRLDPYFSATKLSWILEHFSGLRERAARGDVLFGTVDSWLVWNLTAQRLHVTDASNASRTLLLNIESGQWDETMLQLFQIPRKMLPDVRSSSEVYGIVDPDILPGDIPISGIAGDQQAALFGQTCFQPGMLKNTYGTGCFLLMNTGSTPSFSKNDLLTTIAWKLDGKLTYALEGSVFVAGAVIQWLRDELSIIESASECDRLAESVPDSNGTFLVPAFTGLGAPHWDPNARGSIFGLTRGSNKAHLCRAALESMAFQSTELIECMQGDYGGPLGDLRVDGGASRSDCLLQIQADFLNTPVLRPACVETTALGAAYLAGLAVGFWKDLQAIEQSWHPDSTFIPAMPDATRESLRKYWNRAVRRARDWCLPDQPRTKPISTSGPDPTSR